MPGGLRRRVCYHLPLGVEWAPVGQETEGTGMNSHPLQNEQPLRVSQRSAICWTFEYTRAGPTPARIINSASLQCSRPLDCRLPADRASGGRRSLNWPPWSSGPSVRAPEQPYAPPERVKHRSRAPARGQRMVHGQHRGAPQGSVAGPSQFCIINPLQPTVY